MNLTTAKSPTVLPSDGLVPLASILCTEEFSRRPPRPPDYQTENHALTALAQALADSPQSILQTMAEKMLEVFQCDSAGFSLLTKDQKSFFWPAIAGAWQPHLGGGTPRDFGPCGDVLDRNTPLLFRHWERRYPYLLAATPPAEEGLLVPFYVQGKAVGTIWAIAHDDRRKFDAEDLRQLESLGRFASAAYQAVESLSDRAQRRAALNLMEDAVQSRQAVEKLNAAESLSDREQCRAALNLMEDALQSRQAVEKLNMELRESERRFREMVDALPAAIYTTDADGRLTHFNPECVELSGRTPELGTDHWCVTWKLYHPDGTPMPHEECPMAIALKEGRAVRGAEAIAERPDGTRIWFAPYPTPLKDAEGKVVGGINMLVDITERKRAESLIECQKESLELLVKGEPIEQILDFLARSMESLSEGKFLVAIHLMEEDGYHFGYVAAPSLPARYAEATKGMDARLELGCCSSAVVSHQPTIVRDFADHLPRERWPAFTAEVVSLGLRGCFTTPILSPPPEQRTLGTFAIYYREPRDPSPNDQELVDLVTRTVALAIERKRAEEALRKSEAKHKAIFETVGVSLWEEDFSAVQAAVEALRSQGVSEFRPYFAEHPEFVQKAMALIRVLDVNDATIKMFEAEDKTHLVGSLPAIFVPESLPVFVEELVTVAEGRSYLEAEALLNTVAGNPIHVLFTMRLPPPTEKYNRVLFSVTDITDRKRAEEALRRSEADFRMLADNMAQLAWTCDSLGNVTWYNQRWLDYTGMSFEQMKGWDWSKVQHPDHLERVVARVTRSAETGEPWEDTFPLRGKDGEYHWFLSRAVPIRDATGHIVCWFGTNTDITEQRQMADELRRNAADMSEANRRKNEFLAMLAHELRNPLAPIRNVLQIMRLRGGNGEAVESTTEMMERQVGQMARLVDDLLDVSRISRGKIELRRGRIELASAVNHAVEAARPVVECMDHELTVTLPRQPIYLNADPTRLAQVVGNLLNNACKFTDKGGRIWLTVEQEGEQAVIRVRDTGTGIAAAELPRIFDMFTQVDTSLERVHGGLGIGLMLVKNLVEMHGGTVVVHSAGIRQGSEFVVRLPILVEAAKLPPEPTVSEPAPTTAHRILVVDDNRDSAESLAMLLKLTGNETHTAHDGLEAVEAAAMLKPDMVLLDIGLPKLNGFEAARKIREQPWGKTMVLVALTGWGQEEGRRKSKDAGFDHHMVKPVDHAALMKLLASLESAAVG